MGRRRDFAAALFAGFLMLAGPAHARCERAPDLADYATLNASDIAAGPTVMDRIGRVVASVNVNGQGPFRFIVDTGANRSAVSDALAESLELAPTGEGEVHTVYGVTQAPMIQVDSLRYGDISVNAAALPVLSGAVLAGEHGLLGVDGMSDRRLRIDFDRRCIEIAPSRGVRRLGGWTTVRGELRFGHLVVMRGAVNGIPVSMFLDTGSNSTLANIALRDALRTRAARTVHVDRVHAYTAGEPVVLDTAIALPRVSLGQVDVRNVLAFVGDFHIFHIWDLDNEPALLVGMDVLSRTHGVAIDYGRATVQFDLREVRTGSRLRGQTSAGAAVTR
ncbi:MAG: retroviral-like aspartic protease family protein [Hyphomonadaceae bacterium]